MNTTDLDYGNFIPKLGPYIAKGLPESAAFLDWFLEQIFRLDDVAAHDAICDKSNDKGIDGIYVDEFSEEIVFFQSRLRQNAGASLGDAALKEFMGSVAQFDTPEKVAAILAGNANAELKKILIANNISDKISKGYQPKGVFVCNVDRDHNAIEYLKIQPLLEIYDRKRIADEYIDLTLPSGMAAAFTFTCEQTPLNLSVADLAKMYLFPAAAADLVKLPGISDGGLFSQNVRLSLGNTDVNKAIAKTIKTKEEHKKFPLFHNGITLLCDNATQAPGSLTVTNFVVVNGAQSLSALYHNRSEITSDLRFLLRVIELKGNEGLSNQITLISNNQNAIKPRDLRSNHQIQIRLQREFEELSHKNHVFEVKRGETNEGRVVISNEEAGRLLLAFDLSQPWHCHQLYKIFDELYAQIFGRPEVTAARIIFIRLIMEAITAHMDEVKIKPFANYSLTRFFLLDTIAEILRRDETGNAFARDPSPLLADEALMTKFFGILDKIIKGLIIDMNYEADDLGELFDYKSLLKNQKENRDSRQKLLRAFERDVARQRADTVHQMWNAEAPDTSSAGA